MSSIPKFSTRYWTFYQHQKRNLSQTEIISPGEWGGCVSLPYPSMVLPSIHSFMPGKPSIILHKTSLTGDIQSTPCPTTKSGQKQLLNTSEICSWTLFFSFVLIKSYSAQSTPHLRNTSLVVRWLSMLWSCHSCADLCFCTYVIILHLHLPPSYIKIH